MSKLSKLALPVAAITAALPVVGAPAAQASETISVYTTAYTWYDNTPAGSAQIAHPVIHSVAGGTGTFSDPVTVASSKGRFPYGTKFYIPSLHKYFILEDWGGGASAHGTDAWLDLWIGKAGGASGSQSCAYATTGIRTAILNPAAGYPVSTGAICGSDYSDSVPAKSSSSSSSSSSSKSTSTSSKSTSSSTSSKSDSDKVEAPKAEATVVRAVAKTEAKADKAEAKVVKAEAKVEKKAEKKAEKVAKKSTVRVAATKAVADRAASKSDDAEVYTVKPGDTLSGIAREHGIDNWQDIYNLNQDQIDDPDLIYVGQRFILG